ncbi:hypothetical protein KC480_05550 [Bacillus velezensis]|uniref:hypothetical protein n=1 Tax=Bacillus velezensis TaxID=492670 RepID=UPI001E493C1C|nr:hypothetical protein [Bacillus velezensis]MCD7910988.1 hypothetical protein [Bacillus velezensis]
MANKLLKLNDLFAYIHKTGKSVKYGDLLRLGYQPHHIDFLVKDCLAFFDIDHEGYTIITFRKDV